MKQIEECLNRVFTSKKPLASKKWKAVMLYHAGHDSMLLYLYHYQHLVLVYRLKTNTVLYEWWEKPADKRGLLAAKEYLTKRKQKQEALK